MFISNSEELTYHNLKGSPSKAISREYAIRMFYPFAMRYYEHSRVITIPIEQKMIKRSWFDYVPGFLRVFATRNSLDVWLDKPLYWDNTEDYPCTPDEIIQERVEKGLREFGQPYVLHRNPPRSTTKPEKVVVLKPEELAAIR